MFGRAEKDSFSFNERKVVYSASLSDGRLNQALAIENQVGASALICLATCVWQGRICLEAKRQILPRHKQSTDL